MPAVTRLRPSPSSDFHTTHTKQTLDLISFSSFLPSFPSPPPPFHLPSISWQTTAAVCLLLLGVARLLLLLRVTRKKAKADAPSNATREPISKVTFSKESKESKKSKLKECAKSGKLYAHQHSVYLAPLLPALPADTAAQIISNHYSHSAARPPQNPFTRRSRRVYQIGHPLSLQPYQHAMIGSRGISSVSADLPSSSSSSSSSPPSPPPRAPSPAGPTSPAVLSLFSIDNPVLPPLPLSTSSLSTNVIAGPRSDMAPTDADCAGHLGHTSQSQTVSFIHQPNPDYGADSAAEATETTETTKTTATAATSAAESADTTDSPESAESATPDWTRHTQVYGGGVCLACLAADDDGVGYGDSVPLEMRR